jgi:hypothetical protein
MHKMQGIGNGIEHHPRSAEDTGPLAYRPGQTVFIAHQGKGLFPGAMDLLVSICK